MTNLHGRCKFDTQAKNPSTIGRVGKIKHLVALKCRSNWLVASWPNASICSGCRNGRVFLLHLLLA